MSDFQKILDSFSVKQTLNPKVWTDPNSPNRTKLIPKIRKALLKIADEFTNYLEEDVFVDDVVLTGSLANFNWSEFSDFDLHLYIDFGQYGESGELHKQLFNQKKQIFNENHDIKIYGYDVELYAQDIEEAHYSSGVYSILNDEWLDVPNKITKKLDQNILKNKAKVWINKINSAIKYSTKNQDYEKLENIKNKLKEYRSSGLEKDGELSYENLVFKFLRRSGYIEKLFDALNDSLDKKLSVEIEIK
jgi:predicted nucleotidyltransferase